MKKSLKFKEPVKVELGSGKKFIVNGEELGVDDVTAVRYVFGALVGESELNVIKHNIGVLYKSLHLVEVHLSECESNSEGNWVANHIKWLRDSLPEVAIFVYCGCFRDNEGNMKCDTLLNEVRMVADKIDRLMLLDKADDFGVEEAMRFVKEIEAFSGVGRGKVGLCDSTVGCTVGLGCLSAQLCRELSAKYGSTLDMVVPSKNHEGALGEPGRACNCIGYVEVESLCAKSSPEKAPKKSSKAPSTESTAKTKKEPAPKKPKGIRLVERW